jgi:putative restriction endonuclease
VILGNFAFAYLDPELYALLVDQVARSVLREQLIVAWFGHCRQSLELVLQEELGIDHYEKTLRSHSGGKVGVVEERPPEPIRCAAFRRLVNENYDYRCAASGWRIILPDSRVMVEAAHLVPFAETFDDDPRNGISLVPSFHWALDAHVIAPGPDYLWHVSDLLDDRIADNKPLLELKGKRLMLPKKESFWPKSEALEWRLEHLLSK